MVRARKRLALARTLGLSGLLLSLLCVVGVWVGGALAFVPVQATLHTTQTQLGHLNTQLVQVETAVAPLDALVRPEAQSAVQTLGELARSAQRTPLLGTVFGAENLQRAADLTAQWETVLAGRLPVAQTLTDTRAQLQIWEQWLTRLEQGLRLGALAVGAVLTLLVAWFAAGQWALYRLASGGSAGERE